MRSLNDAIEEIVALANTAKTEKLAADKALSQKNITSTISSDLGKSLVKIAADLKSADDSISYDELNAFMEKARNG